MIILDFISNIFTIIAICWALYSLLMWVFKCKHEYTCHGEDILRKYEDGSIGLNTKLTVTCKLCNNEIIIKYKRQVNEYRIRTIFDK